MRAWLAKRPIQVPELKGIWLVVTAFILQWLLFQFNPLRAYATEDVVRIVLFASQILLFVFIWLNRKHKAFWILGAGLLVNFLVITLNSGLMPISPETVQKMMPNAIPGSWEIGRQLGAGKDIVLPASTTRLWFLSDRFLLPDWAPDQVAFSVGDILIAGGAFWVLWRLGANPATLLVKETLPAEEE